MDTLCTVNDDAKTLADPKLGKVIAGEYTLEEVVGTGGIGTVYRAHSNKTDKPVALKLLHPELTNRELYERFKREANIARSLEHPNIVSSYRCGQGKDGTAFLAMELIDGVNLSDVLHPGVPLDSSRALNLMLQLADALAYAHENNVIHRDIKPSNMLIERSGQQETIKLVDFGMAKLLDEATTLTQKGMVVGSPFYISPEQWDDPANVDGRSDIYALGCVFYLMITGTLPFLANDLESIRRAHLYSTPLTPDVFTGSLTLMPELSEIVLTCIRRDREERYQSSRELFDALDQCRRAFNVRLQHPEKWEDDKIVLPAHIRHVRIRDFPTPFPALIETPFGLRVPPLDGAEKKQETPSEPPAASQAKKLYVSALAFITIVLVGALFYLWYIDGS